MSLRSERDRLLAELDTGQLARRSGKQPKWLEPGAVVTSGTWASSLSDDWIRSMPQVERDAEIRDAAVDYLALRLRPSHRPNFLFLERNSNGAIVRKRSIGLTSSLSVDEARVRVLQMEAERRGLRGLRPHAKCPRNATVTEAWKRYIADDQARMRHTYLVASYLERFGPQRVSETTRDGATGFIRTASLSDPSKAHEMHKRLRAFFTWCVDAGALDGNPLARTPMPERIPGPHIRLTGEALSSIYGASHSLDEPWCRLVRFILLTGLPIDRARRLRTEDIDFEDGALIESAARRDMPPQRRALSSRALVCLINQSAGADFLFQTSRGARRNTAGHLRPSLLQQLQDRSGVLDWSWRDLAASVRLQMRVLAVTEVIDGSVHVNQPATVEAWSETLEHLTSSAGSDPLHGVLL